MIPSFESESKFNFQSIKPSFTFSSQDVCISVTRLILIFRSIFKIDLEANRMAHKKLRGNVKTSSSYIRREGIKMYTQVNRWECLKRIRYILVDSCINYSI